MSTWIDALESIAARYDAFVVDQYGVLHDGRQAYPGAADALLHLRQLGKQVLVLSNSGQRAAYNRSRLARFGFGAAQLNQVLSSGELLHQMLRQRTCAPWQALGRRALVLMPEQAAGVLAGLDLRLAERVEQADFILLLSLPEQTPFDIFSVLLAQALVRRLPLVCANPDKLRLTARGVEPSCGMLAQRYAELGGTVIWVGKPYPLVYQACLQALEPVSAARVLALGDSLEHDIAGAAAAGFDTCFVAGGLHAAAFAACADRAQRPSWLHALCADSLPVGTPEPTWALPTLRWLSCADTDPPNLRSFP